MKRKMGNTGQHRDNFVTLKSCTVFNQDRGEGEGEANSRQPFSCDIHCMRQAYGSRPPSPLRLAIKDRYVSCWCVGC